MSQAKQGPQYGYTIPKRFGKVEIKKETPLAGVQVYLRRWYIWRFKSGASIRLHHILLPDQDPDPHDHPWDFLAIVLRGGYDETWRRSVWMGHRKVRWFSFHRATDSHRITRLVRQKGSWSLFFTGPEKNEWGFLTPEGKVRWKDYAPQGATVGVGARCQQCRDGDPDLCISPAHCRNAVGMA